MSSPSTVLALQRSIGNRAVARLAARADRRLLQRKFGFELELHVPVTSGAKTVDDPIAKTVDDPIAAPEEWTDKEKKSTQVAMVTSDVKPADDPIAAPEGRTGREETSTQAAVPRVLFYVKVDHSAALNKMVPMRARKLTGLETNCPILELVTEPLDELDNTEDDVREQMQALKAFATDIREKTAGFTKRYPLDRLTVPGAAINVGATKNYVGADENDRGDVDDQFKPKLPLIPVPRGVMSVDAFVQQTYGVSLKRVSEEFSERAIQPGSNLLEADREILRSASDDAAKIVSWLANLDSGTADKKDLLRGFFALIAYYLRAGKPRDRPLKSSELGKKLVGLFFFKTKLSTLAKDVAIKQVLDVHRSTIRQKVLEQTGRLDEKELLIPGFEDEQVRVGDFVDQVLEGASDPFFTAAKNKKANQLKAPSLGVDPFKGVGVVMENRKFGRTRGSSEAERLPPERWEQMAVNLYWYLRALHGATDVKGQLLPWPPRAQGEPSEPVKQRTQDEIEALIKAANGGAPPPPPPPLYHHATTSSARH
jgi:hypothetical protein